MVWKNAVIAEWKEVHNPDWEPTRCILMSNVLTNQKGKRVGRKRKGIF